MIFGIIFLEIRILYEVKLMYGICLKFSELNFEFFSGKFSLNEQLLL